MIILITFVPLATLVMFNRSMYSVNEDAGPVQPVLVMSRSLPSETVVEVYNMNGTAFGEYCSVLINYYHNGMTNML